MSFCGYCGAMELVHKLLDLQSEYRDARAVGEWHPSFGERPGREPEAIAEDYAAALRKFVECDRCGA